MNVADLAIAVNSAFNTFRTLVPIDTGNMRYNATQLRSVGYGVYEIVVDKNIAPYVPFTNEPWTSPKWGGKKNPNEGWFDSAADLIANIIAAQLGGRLEKIG